MESETTSVSLSFCYVKIYRSVLHLEYYLLPMPDFVTACIGHLESISSQSYADLPNADTFYFTVKIHNYCQLVSPNSSSEKS